MRRFSTFVGAFVLFMYLLAWLDVVDFNLCIGKPGACIPRQIEKSRLNT